MSFTSTARKDTCWLQLTVWFYEFHEKTKWVRMSCCKFRQSLATVCYLVCSRESNQQTCSQEGGLHCTGLHIHNKNYLLQIDHSWANQIKMGEIKNKTKKKTTHHVYTTGQQLSTRYLFPSSMDLLRALLDYVVIFMILTNERPNSSRLQKKPLK